MSAMQLGRASLEASSSLVASNASNAQDAGDGRRVRLRLCYGGTFVAVSGLERLQAH